MATLAESARNRNSRLDRVEYVSEIRETVFPSSWYLLNSPDHFWFEWRFRTTRRVLDCLKVSQTREIRAFDIGCGTGMLARQFESETAWTVDGTDLNLEALRQHYHGRGRIFYYDIFEQHRELMGAYDLAFLFDVIEHLDQPGPFLEAALAHLKPNGLLLINVPALQYLFSGYDQAAGHYRRYSKATLAAELAGLGVDIVDIRYWGMSMIPLLFLRKWMVAGKVDKDEIIRRGFAPPGRLAHALLRRVMKLETTLLRRPWLGSSVLVAAKKRAVPCS